MQVKAAKEIKSTRSDKRFPFTKEQILNIVKEVEGGLNRKEACIRYGMTYCTMSEWLRRYGSEVYQSSKKTILPDHQKRAIVRLVNEGKMSKDEVCRAHGVKKPLLNSWILRFKRESEQLTASDQQSMAIQHTNQSTDVNEELQQANLKIKALETLIDLAESQFKISIRKKSGAKQ